MSVRPWRWFSRMVSPSLNPCQRFVADWCFCSAGGQAVNSRMERMLSIVPEHIHDRSGIFMGSYDEVQKVIDMHAKHAKA